MGRAQTRKAAPAGAAHSPVSRARDTDTQPVDCKHFGKCGGCQLLDLSYQEEIEQKKAGLERLFADSRLPEVEILPPLASTKPLFYRTSLKVPFGKQGKAIASGFFKPGTHSIVNLKECAIQHPTLTRILTHARMLAERHHVPIYQEYIHRGLLRHLVARVAPGTGEILAGLVVRRGGAPQIRRMARNLFEQFKDDGLVGVVENENPKITNVIWGNRKRVLVGRGYMQEEADGIRVSTSLGSFAQVNTHQASALYSHVIGLLGDAAHGTVLELYAGYGPIALRVAKAGGHVVAVERNPSAIADGRRAARENGLNDRLRYVCQDAATALTDSQELNMDAVIVDPPRRGLGSTLVRSLADNPPPKIVYVSCNPETLVRDLEGLSTKFDVVEIRPVDLFPRTTHIEIVVLLKARGLPLQDMPLDPSPTV